MTAGTPTSTSDMAAAARRSIAHAIKCRARRYARHPQALDALFPGLACASTATLVAIASHLVERERRTPRRWFGFGGEVGLLNARAALLLGRAQRRAARDASRIVPDPGGSRNETIVHRNHRESPSVSPQRPSASGDEEQ